MKRATMKKSIIFFICLIIICLLSVFLFRSLKPEKEVIHEIRNKNHVVSIEKILTNATSANYIQFFVDGKRIRNYKESQIKIKGVECNDSNLFVTYELFDDGKDSIVRDSIL